MKDLLSILLLGIGFLGLTSCSVIGVTVGSLLDKRAAEPVTEGQNWVEPHWKGHEITLEAIDKTYTGKFRGYETEIMEEDTLRSIMFKQDKGSRILIPEHRITYTCIKPDKGNRKYYGLGAGLVIDIIVVKTLMELGSMNLSIF